MEGEAILDRSQRYRYVLRRRWEGEGSVLFVLLNPSTADAQQDDPTLRRCVGFARAWGLGGLTVCNLFAYRATSPKDLRVARSNIGPSNNEHLRREAKAAERIVVGWGRHGAWQSRARDVCTLLQAYPLYCLRHNRDGTPRHPLYVPRHATLERYRAASMGSSRQ